MSARERAEAAREAWEKWTNGEWAEEYPPGEWYELLAQAEELAHTLIATLTADRDAERKRADRAEAELRRAFYSVIRGGPQWEPKGWLVEVLSRDENAPREQATQSEGGEG